MRRLLILLHAIPLLALPIVGSRADASSILYNTTNLGTGFYTLQTNPNGSDYGLTPASGGVTYAFDKSPTTNSVGSYTTSPYDNQSGGVGSHQYLNLQNGTHRVGYDDTFFSEAPASFSRPPGGSLEIYHPSFESPTNGWYLPSRLVPVVEDLNSQGQAVGLSLLPNAATTALGGGANNTYAAFSAVNGQGHGGNAAIVDNLNNYIASIPGVSLISAITIDDLGRIVAGGSDGNAYLLTPVALGGVETVPEPTTLATLGSLVAMLCYRAARCGRLRKAIL